MSRYLITKPAIRDLEEILSFIAEDRPETALRVGARLTSTFEALARNPEMGHYRDDLTDKPVRFWPFYSYLIVYRADTTPLQILRVLRGYRDIASLLRKPE